MTQKTSIKNLARILEWSLLAVGLALLVIYSAARIDSALASHAAIADFEESQSPEGSEHLSASNTEDVDFTLWSEKRKVAYQESLHSKFPSALAILSIDAIGLKAPVFEGTDDLTLNRGVGRIAGTASIGGLGNLGIAGHRDGFFRGLKDVSVGTTIRLTTPDEVEIYQIEKIIIVDPTDTWVLQTRGTPYLTLVTCYPFYYIGDAPKRYIVQAKRTDTQPLPLARTKVSNSNLNSSPQENMK